MKSAAIMIMTAVMTSAAQPAKSPVGREVTVYLYDSNSIDLRIEAPAKALASDMFSGIGVHLRWKSGHPPHTEAGAIVIEFVTDAPAAFKPDALAYALLYEGVHIRILWDRIEVSHSHAILAHVMVHEITHILQGVDRHSAEGIMKARWTPADFRAMLSRPLKFTDEDVELIYQGLDKDEAQTSAMVETHAK
jgi:hypothetical protein